MSVFKKETSASEIAPADLNGLAASAATEKPIPVPPEMLTPAAQAYMNSQLTATIKAMFSELRASQQNAQMTPETLAAAFAEAERQRRLPSEDEVARKAREIRERAKSRRDIEEARKLTEATQQACDHLYPNGSLALCVIGNRPDRQKLLVCLLHHCIISPSQWIIDAPDKNGNEQSHIEPAHKDYVRLMRTYEKQHQQ